MQKRGSVNRRERRRRAREITKFQRERHKENIVKDAMRRLSAPGDSTFEPAWRKP